MFLLVAIPTAIAQDKVEKPEQTQEELVNDLRTELIDAHAKLDHLQDEIYKMHVDYARKYYAYLGEKADVHIEQFKWQRSASEILLWLVVVVVFSGVLFSGIQLWRAGTIKDLGDTSIEIEARKIKVTSSVVGVIVLAISIIFFYFFLIEVYRIKIVDLQQTEIAPESLEKKSKDISMSNINVQPNKSHHE